MLACQDLCRGNDKKDDKKDDNNKKKKKKKDNNKKKKNDNKKKKNKKKKNKKKDDSDTSEELSPVLDTSPVSDSANNYVLVTTLDDNGSDKDPTPGSLRAAVVNASGSGRTLIQFAVSGTITLLDPLKIESPNITIDGQAQVDITGWTIVVRASNTTLRKLRIKPGNRVAPPDKRNRVDCITIGESGDAQIENVRVEHCSLYWSCDEIVSVFNAKNVHIHACILAEALHDAGHPEGPHSKALLMGSLDSVTITQCVIAHCYARVPRFPAAGRVNFVNNMIFNWGDVYAGYSSGSASDERAYVNVVGNVVIAGADSRTDSKKSCWLRLFGNGHYYFDDNLLHPGSLALYELKSDSIALAKDPTHALPLGVIPARDVEGAIMPIVGARTGGNRDANDERLLRLVTLRSGRIVDEMGDV